MAPLGTPEPVDLVTAYDAAWVPVGYTEDGHELAIENTFEEIRVDEELLPIRRTQTERNVTVSFSMAELTEDNLTTALNGGTVTTGTGIVTFEPPSVDDEPAKVMLSWQSFDGKERWVYRQCLSTGGANIARRKGEKAVIPVEFSLEVPESGDPEFAWIRSTS